jgi:indole-3-glycerol phosphate synthase
MADFLRAMTIASERRVLHARRGRPEAEVRMRALETPPAPPLVRDADGFDIIAEVKRHAPSAAGARAGRSREADLPARLASDYARAGAVAVSVLTEPLAFDGDLEDLAAAARALAVAERPVPAMRKDFIVAPYQVFEARAAGAGGVLLIADMIDDAAATALIDAAAEAGVWVLVEAFRTEQIERAVKLARAARAAGLEGLVGVNARDLRSLQVDTFRHARVAHSLPSDIPGVAESGVASAEDAARTARLGYRLALVGSALVASPEPGRSLALMIAAGRAARRAA